MVLQKEKQGIGIMSDRIVINPFTNTALSASEILQLDANQDGIVSSDELYSNAEFIAKYTSEDAEGDVQIEEKEGDFDNIKDFGSGLWTIARAPFEAIAGSVKGGIAFTGGVLTHVGSVIGGAASGGWTILKGIGGYFGHTFNGAIGGVKSLFGGFFGGFGQIFKGNILGGIGTIFKGIGNSIWQPIKGIGKGIAAVGKGIVNGVKKVGKGIVNGVKAVGEGIGKAAKAVGKGIANAAKAIGKGIKKIFSGW